MQLHGTSMKLCNANVCFMFSVDKVFYVNTVLMQIIWFQYCLLATNILSLCLEITLLSGPLVKTAQCILRLWVEATVSW